PARHRLLEGLFELLDTRGRRTDRVGVLVTVERGVREARVESLQLAFQPLDLIGERLELPTLAERQLPGSPGIGGWGCGRATHGLLRPAPTAADRTAASCVRGAGSRSRPTGAAARARPAPPRGHGAF